MYYLALEGNEGTGKSTILGMLRETFKNDQRLVFTREPGSLFDPIAESIRQEMFKHKDINPLALQLMMCASRVQQWMDTINRNGKLFVSDRSWVSTMIYFQKDMEERQWELKTHLNNWMMNDILVPFLQMKIFPEPDYLVYLKVDPEESIRRTGKREMDAKDATIYDDMGIDQIRKINDLYDDAVAAVPHLCEKTRIVEIDTTEASPQEVYNSVFAIVKGLREQL